MRNDFESNYLAHYGVEGMKWGVRRYQNPDGTLTTLGREHYGYSSSKKGDGDIKTSAKKVADNVSTTAKKAHNTAVNKSAKKKNTKTMREARSKNIDEMTTNELREYNNRLQEEQRFRNLTESDSTKTKRWIKNIGKESLKVVASAALVTVGKAFVKLHFGIGSPKEGKAGGKYVQSIKDDRARRAREELESVKKKGEKEIAPSKEKLESAKARAEKYTTAMDRKAANRQKKADEARIFKKSAQDRADRARREAEDVRTSTSRDVEDRRKVVESKQARIDRRVARFEKKADTRQRQADDYRNGKTVTNAMISRIRSLVKSGKTQEEIAKALGVSASTVNKYIR